MHCCWTDRRMFFATHGKSNLHGQLDSNNNKKHKNFDQQEWFVTTTAPECFVKNKQVIIAVNKNNLNIFSKQERNKNLKIFSCLITENLPKQIELFVIAIVHKLFLFSLLKSEMYLVRGLKYG